MQDLHALETYAPIAEINDDSAWLFTAQDFRFLELLAELVSTIGIAKDTSRAHDESTSGGNSTANRVPKRIRVPGFPFADALDFRSMQGIKLGLGLHLGCWARVFPHAPASFAANSLS